LLMVLSLDYAVSQSMLSGNTTAYSPLSICQTLLAGRRMLGRRHLGRASEFLSVGASLFDAFIGQLLRERYALPQEVPPHVQRLLTQLDEPGTGVQDLAATSAYGRAAKENTKAP
jgi:hypothetical protein